MKKILIASVLAISILLNSCSALTTGTSAVSVINTVSGLVYYYDNGDVVEFLNQAPLSTREQEQVAKALTLLDESRVKMHQYAGDPLMLAANANSVALDYLKIKLAYVNIRNIAINHQASYSREAWQIMEMFDLLATQLDVQFQEFLTSARNSDAVNSAILLAGTVIRVAAVL